jgi:mRNA-degrading endonuclease RelE of RelBE toxin-antitoxin system
MPSGALKIVWTDEARADIRSLDRLRLGDYGISFREVGEALRVLRVKHRREAYR